MLYREAPKGLKVFPIVEKSQEFKKIVIVFPVVAPRGVKEAKKIEIGHIKWKKQNLHDFSASTSPIFIWIDLLHRY